MRFLFMLFVIVNIFFTAYTVEAAQPFSQGSGYEQGAYDVNAIQPTSEN